jgi:hypothetical protein
MDDRDPGAHGLSADERYHANLQAGDIGNGIEFPRGSFKWDAQIAGAWFGDHGHSSHTHCTRKVPQLKLQDFEEVEITY